MATELKGVTMDGRQAKDVLYEQFALTGKAVASPKRVEVLELLAQGEHTVRLQDGMPEWRLAGLPVATGTE